MTAPKDEDDHVRTWLREEETKLSAVTVDLPDARVTPAAPHYSPFSNRPLAQSWECGWCAAVVADRDKHSHFHRTMWQVMV